MQVREFLAKIEQGQRDFRNVALPKAKLHSAQLPLLNLDGANLEGADFTNANLAGSSLCHAQLEQSKMSGVNLLGAQCVKTSFRGADLSNALLSGAEFQGCNFKQANLTNASCVGVDLSGANLRYANLSRVNLKAAKLKGTDLYGANLEGADLEGADLQDLIWPDGTGQLMIDEGVTEDQDDSMETVNIAVRSFGTFAGQTSVQSPAQTAQESLNAESQVRFGDFALDDHTSRLGGFSSFPTPSESVQQRSLKLASQIASRLDRQVEYRFKKAVKSAYGDRCALSKSSIISLLETVVIFPEAENDRDHPSNGLLLRVDLARLFQVNLIAIHPTNYRVILSPSLRGSEYASFEGIKLNLPQKVDYHPKSDCLQAHFNQCDWIGDRQENLESVSEKVITESSSEDFIPQTKVNSSRFVDLSKTWLKRINDVLHTPISAKLPSEKKDEKALEEADRRSVNFVPIVADSEPEFQLETDIYSVTSEISDVSQTLGSEPLGHEGEVFGDAFVDTSDTSVDSEEQQVEVIGFSAIEVTSEETEEQSLTEETTEEEIESTEPSSSSPLKQGSSFLPFRSFPSFPSIFRPSSVTLNLDRLQSDLDAISKELEPYLPSTEPIENVADLIENIEKELQDDLEDQSVGVEEQSEVVDESFVALFGSPLDQQDGEQETIDQVEESSDSEETVLVASDRSAQLERHETIESLESVDLQEHDSPFVAVSETIDTVEDNQDIEESESPFVAVSETIEMAEDNQSEESESPFVAISETIEMAEDNQSEESESPFAAISETIENLESVDLQEHDSPFVTVSETIESLESVDLQEHDSPFVTVSETIEMTEDSQDIEESPSVAISETIDTVEDSQDIEESESTFVAISETIEMTEDSQDIEESDSISVVVSETIDTIEDNQDIEESDSSSVAISETIEMPEDSQDLEESPSVAISETIDETVSDSQDSQKDLFDNWQDTSSETHTDQEPSVTTEELTQDFEAEKEVQEEPTPPKPVRKGLAALLFRRFIP